MTEFITYMIKVAVLSAAFIGLYHLLLRRETFHKTNRIILVASLVLSYILPLCVITVHREGNAVKNAAVQTETPENLRPGPTVEAGSIYAETSVPAATHNLTQVIEVPADEAPEYAPAIKKRRPADWWKIAGVVYIIGLIGILAFRILSTSKVIGIIKKGHVIDKSDTCTIVESKRSVHPFSWMKYIVLPEKGKAAGQSVILDHEKAHLAHHHSLELLLTDLLSALQWFNPALVLFRHDLCSIHEFQADADVLETGCDRRQYQYLLLDCATEKTEFRAANTFRKSTLEGRIDMINRKKSSKSSTLKMAYLPVLLLVSLSVFAEKIYDKSPAVDTEEAVVEVGNYVRIDGLWYKFKGKEARVVSRKTEHAYPADIVIPDTVIYRNVRYAVTSISQMAFSSAREIKTVTIPPTISEIENNSFIFCTNLRSVTIPSSVSRIGLSAFGQCKNLTSVIIPASVKIIDENAFAGAGLEYIKVDPNNKFYDSRDDCNAVIKKSSGVLVVGSANTVIPQSVTEIGFNAFAGNEKIESLTIPSNITKIGSGAFENCTSLTSVEIPETVKELEFGCFSESGIRYAKVNGNNLSLNYAFDRCDSLETVEFGPNVTETDIPSSTNMKSLHIPANIEKIDNSSFSEMKRFHNLESITVDPGNPNYDSRGGCNAIIETATNTLILGCNSTVIPNTVKSISDYAFSGSNIRKLFIPASVTWISIYPDFGNAASHQCFASNCTELESIAVDPANPVYDSREGCNAIIEKASGKLLFACKSTVIPNSVIGIGAYAFEKQKNLTQVTIPDAVVTIGQMAFSECENIDRLTIGTGVSDIAPDAFYGCYGMSEIKVSPNNRKYDGKHECNALIDKESGTLILGCSSTIIPDGVKTIGKGAFRRNTKLTALTLPPSVTTIEDDAFEGCSNLREINLENVTRKANSVFSGSPIGGRYVEGELFNFILWGKEAYLTTSNDNVEKNVTIPEYFDFEGLKYTVTMIENGSFMDNTAIESVTVPETVRQIGDRAFSGCSNLKKVTLKDGLTAIGEDAFAGCSRLEAIRLPSTLESIGRTAFTETGLKSLDIPESVSEIGRNIVLNCRNLKSLSVSPKNSTFDSRKNCNAIIRTESDVLLEGCSNTRIPQGVIAIGPYAFAGMNGFKSMIIPSSVRYIFEEAFAFSAIEKIDIPASVSLMYSAFFGCGKIKSITVQDGNPTYSSPQNCNAIISNGNESRVIEDEKVSELLDYFKLPHYMDISPGTLVQGCMNTVIPESAVILGRNAFSFCDGIETIDIPEGVSAVETNAFTHCSNLKEIHYPASAGYLGTLEFCPNIERITVAEGNPHFDSREDCNALILSKGENEEMSDILITGCRNTVIPNSVKAIATNAFAHVRGLKSAYIPESVICIERDAFLDCANLESVTIGKSVKGYGMDIWDGPDFEYNPHLIYRMNPFGYCPNLKNISVDPANPYYNSSGNCNAVIMTSMGVLFTGCSETVEPETVTDVHISAYDTMSDCYKDIDYLSTKRIFPDGDLSHIVLIPDLDD